SDPARNRRAEPSPRNVLMRPRFLRLPFLALLLMAGRVALAADPVGTWAVDTAALRDEYRRLMETDLADMPAAQRAQTEAVLPGRLDEMAHRSAGTADFRPDGTVVLEDYEGQRRTGRWSLGADGVHVESGDEPP